jgi:hypothetical protein
MWVLAFARTQNLHAWAVEYFGFDWSLLADPWQFGFVHSASPPRVALSLFDCQLECRNC